jgi:hypothetical protein
MSLIQLNWEPKTRDLRSFGAIFMGGFVLIGLVKYFWPFGWLLARNETFGLWMIGIGVFVGSIGLTGTRVALPFYWAWLGIAFVLGNVMSRVLVTLVYFLIFTPMRFLGALVGRDKLQLNKPDTESYWLDLAAPADPARYERQF